MTEDEYRKIRQEGKNLERLDYVWFINLSQGGYKVRKGKVFCDECDYRISVGVKYFDTPRYKGDEGEFEAWIGIRDVFRGKKGALRGMADKYKGDAIHWSNMYAKTKKLLSELENKVKTYQQNDNTFWLKVGQDD